MLMHDDDDNGVLTERSRMMESEPPLEFVLDPIQQRRLSSDVPEKCSKH